MQRFLNALPGGSLAQWSAVIAILLCAGGSTAHGELLQTTAWGTWNFGGEFGGAAGDAFDQTTDDLNSDGAVDIGDFALWADSYGQTGAGVPAELNHDSDSGDSTITTDSYQYPLTGGGDSAGDTIDDFGAGFTKEDLRGIEELYWGAGDNTAGTISSVPEPSSLALFGIGILALIAYGWRRRSV